MNGFNNTFLAMNTKIYCHITLPVGLHGPKLPRAARENEQQGVLTMRKRFVKTENYARFTEAIHARGASGSIRSGDDACGMDSPAPAKSQVTSRWASEVKALYLRANVDWTPRYFLVELAKSLGAEPYGTSSSLFSHLLDRLAGSTIPLVIDEAEFTLPNIAAVLEKVRDFSDRAEITVVLVGMESIRRKIARHQQIFSRIAQVVEFHPAALADIRQACEQLTDIGMSEALMAEVHRISGGRMREALNVIAGIEHIAKLNGLTRVDVMDLEGGGPLLRLEELHAEVRPASAGDIASDPCGSFDGKGAVDGLARAFHPGRSQERPEAHAADRGDAGHSAHQPPLLPSSAGGAGTYHVKRGLPPDY